MNLARLSALTLAIAITPALAHSANAPPQGATPAEISRCDADGITRPVMQTKLLLQDSYPPMSVVLGEEGSTVVNFVVRKNGTVTNVTIGASSGFLRLDDASVSAMAQMLYSQPRRGNDVIDCQYHVRIVWKLTGDDDNPLQSQRLMVLTPPPSWYPAQARAEHREGAVLVAVAIGMEGALMNAKVYKSSGSEDLDNASLAYVKTLRVKPAEIDGKLSVSTVDVAIAWTLDPKEKPAASGNK